MSAHDDDVALMLELIEALRRSRRCMQALLAGMAVRDVTETLAEIDAVLAKVSS